MIAKTYLMHKYEEETGNESTQIIAVDLKIWHFEYVAWLEAIVNDTRQRLTPAQENAYKGSPRDLYHNLV